MSVVEGGGEQFEEAPGPIKLALKAFIEWEGILHNLAPEHAADIAAEYLEDNRGLSLAGFADVLVACAGHADADALLKVIDDVASDPRFRDLVSLVDSGPLSAGFAQSWVAAHPGLPGSKASERNWVSLVNGFKLMRTGVEPVEIQDALLEAVARDDVAQWVRSSASALRGRCGSTAERVRLRRCGRR
jgi:hypothetical protein